MLPEFFRRHSRLVLGFLVLTFPYLFVTAESLTSNNDIETWLPGEAPVRRIYDGFKERFGAEELVLVGLPGEESEGAVDEELVEAVCERIEALPGIRVCWSPYRLMSIMQDLGVERDEARRRLEGLSATRGPDGLIGIAALLSAEGLADRVGTVNAVREALAECQLEESQLAGAPVIVSELDRLGSLHGEIGIADCQSADIARVLVYHGRQLMAEAVVTGDGGFRIDGLSGGVYWLSAPGTGRAVRAWSQGCLDV